VDEGVGGFGLVVPGVVILFMCIALVIGAVLVAFPAGRVCKRVGFSPWLGLLAMFPLFNLLLLWYVALADWPNVPRTQGPGA
jgi:hypothetical protein